MSVCRMTGDFVSGTGLVIDKKVVDKWIMMGYQEFFTLEKHLHSALKGKTMKDLVGRRVVKSNSVSFILKNRTVVGITKLKW